jgi:hypothetical protein
MIHLVNLELGLSISDHWVYHTVKKKRKKKIGDQFDVSRTKTRSELSISVPGQDTELRRGPLSIIPDKAFTSRASLMRDLPIPSMTCHDKLRSISYVLIQALQCEKDFFKKYGIYL